MNWCQHNNICQTLTGDSARGLCMTTATPKGHGKTAYDIFSTACVAHDLGKSWNVVLNRSPTTTTRNAALDDPRSQCVVRKRTAHRGGLSPNAKSRRCRVIRAYLKRNEASVPTTMQSNDETPNHTIHAGYLLHPPQLMLPPRGHSTHPRWGSADRRSWHASAQRRRKTPVYRDRVKSVQCKTRQPTFVC
jgi:hypothetical protein